MTTLTFGLLAPDDGDNSSIWFPALRANFVAIDAHTHDGISSPLVPFANVSPLTTKGDLLSFSILNLRVPIGSDTQVLTADSSQAAGLKWAAPANAPDSSYEITNLTLAASVGSSALTISLKTKAGTNPSSTDVVKIGFRSATSASGLYSQISTTSALSTVISSGSTLGHKDAVESFIYIYALNNAGTIELAYSSSYFDEGTRRSTTAEGGAGAADSPGVLYSTTARTNIAIRLIGRFRSTQTTAGTWAAVPTEISLKPFAYEAMLTPWSTNLTFTPSSSAFGTVVGPVFHSRRVGDSLEVRFFFKTGTVSGASNAQIALPTGLTLDTTKVASSLDTVIGNYYTTDGSATTFFDSNKAGVVYYKSGSTTTVSLSNRSDTNGSSVLIQASGGDLASTGGQVGGYFTVPIAEWA